MTDFTEGLRKLVEDTATRVAEGVLQRGLTLVEDLQRRADALLRDAEHARTRWNAINGIVEAASKAAASEGMLARASSVYVSTFVTGGTPVGDARLEFPASGSFHTLVPWGQSDAGRAALEPGRYTAIVAFYKQGA